MYHMLLIVFIIMQIIEHIIVTHTHRLCYVSISV